MGMTPQLDSLALAISRVVIQRVYCYRFDPHFIECLRDIKHRFYIMQAIQFDAKKNAANINRALGCIILLFTYLMYI